jgi:bacteriocin-like protein
MPKKPKKSEPDKETDDLELEITDDELANVSGGRGIRVKNIGRRAARVKGLRGRRMLPRIKRPVKKL